MTKKRKEAIIHFKIFTYLSKKFNRDGHYYHFISERKLQIRYRRNISLNMRTRIEKDGQDIYINDNEADQLIGQYPEIYMDYLIYATSPP